MNFRVSRVHLHLSTFAFKKRHQLPFVCAFEKRVAIALWKLATGGEYRSVSHLFGVGLTTVFNCVKDFCNAVNKVLLPVHIKFPDARKLVEMASFFEQRWGVPQCVGAIDGSHIPIIAPTEYPRDFFN